VHSHNFGVKYLRRDGVRHFPAASLRLPAINSYYGKNVSPDLYLLAGYMHVMPPQKEVRKFCQETSFLFTILHKLTSKTTSKSKSEPEEDGKLLAGRQIKQKKKFPFIFVCWFRSRHLFLVGKLLVCL